MNHMMLRFLLRRTALSSIFALALTVTSQGIGAIEAVSAPIMVAEQQNAAQGEYPTLAAALADAAIPPSGTIVLSIGAERVNLPKPDATGAVKILRPGSSVRQIAQRFNLLTRAFGPVTVLAPETMTLINTRPENPNAYLGMPMTDVLTLLLGTLTDGQWQAITGAQGLPISTLTTPDQELLVTALLPKGKLTVEPWVASFADAKKEDIRDLSGSLSQSRLRLSQSFSVGYPAEENLNTQYQSSDIPPAPDGPTRYQVTEREQYGGSQDSLYGVWIRETVPNREKRGNLPFTDPRLNAAISLDGLKTVGDLIRRIAERTGIDLYADPRYGARSLTVVSSMSASRASAAARDLLRAVGLGMTATYRRVGPADEPRPAFILTDDLVGMGTRQSLWYEFELDGAAQRAGAISKSAQSLHTRFGPRSITAYGDDTALAVPTAGAQPAPDMQDRDRLPGIHKPFTELTAEQQAAVKRVIEQHNRMYKSQPAVAAGTIDLYPLVRLELLAPSLPEPVDMKVPVSQGMLFRPSKEAKEAKRKLEQAAEEKQLKEYLAAHPEARAKMGAKPRLGPPPPRRAVIVSPRTSAEIDEAIAAMKRLDLNELWLDLPLMDDPAAESTSERPNADTLLAAALKATEKTGIRVLPVVSPFAEGMPLEMWRDRNFMGETSADAERHVQERSLLLATDENVRPMGQEEARPIPPVFVNPLAPGFASAAEVRIRKLASKPGIAGLVFRETDPPGYEAVRGGDDMSRRLLGYAEAMRLAFVREFGADPVDLYTPNYYTGKAKTSVPIQDYGSALLSEKYQDWKRFRRAQNLQLLRTLRVAAGTVPVIVRQRRGSGTAGSYGSWDDPKGMPPTLYRAGDEDHLGGSAADLSASAGPAEMQAARQSLSVLNLLSLDGFLYLSSNGGLSIPAQAVGAQDKRPRSDGYVLDMTLPTLDPLRQPRKLPTTLTGLADSLKR